MSLRRLIPFLALASALSVPPTVAQEAQEAAKVAITGYVVDEATGEPVPDVIVVVEALGLNLLTDAGGQFVIADVPRGLYILQPFHQDYERLDGDLRIDRPGKFSLIMKPIQDPDDSMITGVVGVVTDNVSGDRIPDVVVNVPGVGRVTTTDADGRFSLAELVSGRHEVAFSHLGYQPRSTIIEVETGHATKVHVALTVEAIALDPIDVTVERRDRNLESVGFYQREEAAGATSWTGTISNSGIPRGSPMRSCACRSADLDGPADAVSPFPHVRWRLLPGCLSRWGHDRQRAWTR